MKNIFIISILFLISACAGGNQFAYDRKTSCEINYGHNGISIIVDKDNILIKNNRQDGFGSVLSARTADRVYYTSSRYFSNGDIDDIINSLRNSQKLYLQWKLPGTNYSSGDIRTNIIDVADFGKELDQCLTAQHHSYTGKEPVQ